MAEDIFDKVAAQPKGDMFDQIAPKAQILTAPPPPTTRRGAIEEPTRHSLSPEADLFNSGQLIPGLKNLGGILMNTAPQASPDFPATGSRLLDYAHDALRSGTLGQGKMGGGLVEAIKDSPLVHTAKSLKGLLPSTERAGENFNTIMEQAKNVKTPMGGVNPILQRAYELEKAGNPMPGPLKAAINAEDIRYGPVADTPGSFDLASTAKRLSREELARVKGTPMQAQVKQFAGAMNDANRQVAQSVGMGQIFDAAMKEYRQAMTLKDTIAVARKYAPLLAATGLGLGGARYVGRRALTDLLKP